MTRPPTPAIERLMRRVRITTSDGCWDWPGAKDHGGYGKIGVGSRADGMTPIHRVTYEHYVGPIPDGLVIDHLCRNRGCCNPMHLEPVTPGENSRRGLTGAAERARTHCPQGHPYSGDNLYVRSDGRRQRRACHRATNQRLRAKKVMA